MLRDLHDGTEAAVCMHGGISEWFGVQTGVRQGCVIAPMLFNIFIDYIVRESLIDMPHGFKIGYKLNGQLKWINTDDRNATRLLLQNLLYADDMVLLCDNIQGLEALVHRIDAVTQKWGMQINVAKTKILSVVRSSTQPDTPIEIRGQVVEVVDSFTYLGSVVCSDTSLDAEITKRISSAAAAFHRMDKIWRDRHLSIGVKMLVYRTIVVPALLYACETWTPLTRHVCKLEVFQNNCLRRILGVSRLDRVTVDDIRRRCQSQPSVKFALEIARLRWLGHLCRLNDSRICKRILFSGTIPDKKRSRGHPKTRWNDLVDGGVSKVKPRGRARWFDACKDRSTWKMLIREAASELAR